MTRRVMVDMSATLLHHGHIRLLEKASAWGRVIVGLTTDDEIEKCKLYQPELTYDEREEILRAIRFVHDVVPTPWLITEAILDSYDIDLLVHGDDNRNDIHPDRILILPRTEGISSTLLRQRGATSLVAIEARTAKPD